LKPARHAAPNASGASTLQKTKIPARGLKLETHRDGSAHEPITASKNQNPREGIETLAGASSSNTSASSFKKPKSPRGD